MKKIYIVSAIAFFLFSGLLSQQANAQIPSSDTANANVTLNIFTTISVDNAGDLEVSLFPDVLPFEEDFTIDPEGTVSAGDANLFQEVTPAEFEITFAADQEVDVTVTGSATFDISTMGGTAGTVTFEDFTLPGGSDAEAITLGSNVETFRLGYSIVTTGVETGGNISETTNDNPIEVEVSFQ